jgi:sugar phosphate isomerase/epimerase
VSAHPRISVNQLSSWNQSFDDDISMWRALDVDNVGLINLKLDTVGWSRTLVRDAGLRVSNIATQPEQIRESLEFAGDTGVSVVYVTTGAMDGRPWEDIAESFCEEVAPMVALARDLGVNYALEPTNPLRSDLSFIYTLRDAIDLARMAGMTVTLDFYSCWYERGFEELVRKNVDLIALVQIDDFAIGTTDTPNRAVIGDGNVPVERLLGIILDAGYEGMFDLEILGPRIEAEGYASAIERSLAGANEILDRLGA